MRATVTALPLVLLLVPGPAPGQEEPAPEAPAGEETGFSEIVDVELVEVDVRVTDRQGRPVRGLTADDFQVFEDGRRVPITNFRVVEGIEPPRRDDLPRSAGEPPPLPVLDQAGVAAAATELARPPHLILFVDNVNIRPLHRTRVMNELRRFVVDLDVPARIMVVSYDRRLEVRQRFTTDASNVLRALDELEEAPVFGETLHDDFRELVREIEDRYVPQAVLERRVEGYAQEIQLQLRQSLEALRGLIDTLAGLEGRKALVHVSDGLPLNPAEELFNALEMRFQNLTVLHRSMKFNAARDFETLAQMANTAGVTFYTLHAAGLEAPMASDAEVAGSGFDELRHTVDSVRLANTQGSGRLLAAETGGLAFLNQNSFLDGLGQMVEDLTSYYSLGYRPRHAGDGRYHKIEVKTGDRRHQLRHRRGYRDRPRSQRMSDLVASTVHHGFAENPMEVTVAVGAAEGDDLGSSDGTSVVAVRVGIPMGNIVLVPQGDGYRGRVRLYVGVQDRDGDTSPTQEIPVAVTIPGDAIDRARGESWVQEIKLRMRPGPHLLVVGLWDEIGLESSVAAERVVIGRAAG